LFDKANLQRFDLESANLSVELLDSLLLSESVTVESEDALLGVILKLGPDYRDLLRHIQIGFLSEDGLCLLEEHLPPESLWQFAAETIAHSQMDSRIILGTFPEIFAEFRGKHFEILWRGSRDGFSAKEFHRRCDWHANTLTVILDTNGNIFGGFTPVEWESRAWNGKYGIESNLWKADDSLLSFVFTLKNPHNVPARRFALKAEKKNEAIYCDSKWGPCFREIAVFDNCDVNTDSYSYFDGSNDIPTNEIGVDGHTIFTGSLNFKVKELEVFEIRD
jgi:hypothetical protein